MGFTAVVKGIGRGSVFGNGRILGVHNPFGSDLAKASDPFIKLSTLARLSHSGDPQVRQAVIDNLWAKDNHYNPRHKVTLKDIDAFDRLLLLQGLTEKVESSPWLGVTGATQALLGKFHAAEWTQLSQSKNCYFRSDVASFTHAPKAALVALAQDVKGGAAYSVAEKAYRTVEAQLSPEELTAFAASTSAEIRERVAANPKTPRKVLLQLAMEWPMNDILHTPAVIWENTVSFLYGRRQEYRCISNTAFQNLVAVKELTADDLDFLGKHCEHNMDILFAVLEHPLTSDATKAELMTRKGLRIERAKATLEENRVAETKPATSHRSTSGEGSSSPSRTRLSKGFPSFGWPDEEE